MAFSMKFVALLAIAVVLVVSMAGDASAQSYGGFVQNGGAGEDGGSGGGEEQGGGGNGGGGNGGGGNGGGGGGSQDRGPIQFPPAPMLEEMSSVVIGGSGFGFVPPRADRFNNNFGPIGGFQGGNALGSGYGGGSSLGSGYRGSSTLGGGYRGSNALGGGYRGSNALGGGYRGSNALGGGYRVSNALGSGYSGSFPVSGGYRSSGSSHIGGLGGYGFRSGAYPSAAQSGLPSFVSYVNHG